MTHPRLAGLALAAALLALPASGQQPDPPPEKKAEPEKKDPPKGQPPRWATGRMPRTGLAPAKLTPDLCVYRYRVGTDSALCQAYVDQGLGYFYSYVWMEAARSFETALQHDPDCPAAYWCLYRALTQWGKRDAGLKALLRADELKGRAAEREKLLILASMYETGNAPNAGDGEARKKKAVETIDNLLATHDDDEEGWYYRAQLAGGAGGFGGVVSAVPYYKALWQLNPLHPGANHELLHFYEKYQRPALGWLYAENYIKSSPGLPHAFHMQAHLATRLGRWQKTSDRSARAVELERAYHKEMGVSPREDQQFSHHLETLLVSLTHDGRFAEGRAVRKEMEAAGYKLWQPWFRLHLAERDWAECQKVIDQFRKNDKATASYCAALMYLRRGDAGRALPEVEVLQGAQRDRKHDKGLEMRLWEVQGLYQCLAGDADAGLKLLQKAVDRTKGDYGHHAWGNGAVLMEAWGAGALAAGRDAVAEEAFLEALAHDPGSVRAALGMQILCGEQGRSEEAGRFAELARRCWARADSGRVDVELSALRALRPAARGVASGAGR